MHVLIYISKNQENLKLLSNINVYLLNANLSEYMSEKNSQERIKIEKRRALLLSYSCSLMWREVVVLLALKKRY